MGNIEYMEDSNGDAETGASTMTNDYDEDLSQNPFFQAFLHTYVDLFSQCVCEKWIICVPRRISLPKHAFTLDDFTHHILKPLNLCQELKSRSRHPTTNGGDDGSGTDGSCPSLSRESSCSNLSATNGSLCSSGTHCGPPSQRNWNFRSLSDVNLEYVDNTLILDSTESSTVIGTNNNNSRSVAVLFEETFYTPDKAKYKILCIAAPLNSKVEECADEDGHRQLRSPSLWNLTSLRDCIDFLWLNGKPKSLEKYDAHIKLFLHNHRALEDLPLPVQRDLVYDLYTKCLTHATRGGRPSRRLKKKSPSGSSQSSSTETIDSSNSPLPPTPETTQSLQNFKLATETYVLNGIYRQLSNAITSSVSFEDSQLNKVIRNLQEIHPQDLEINIIHWDNLSRARKELSRLSLYSSPLAKLNCLKKTMRYLKPDKNLTIIDESSGRLSADELLPIWVYLIVKTPLETLDNWTAQLQFLKYFRFSSMDNENSAENENSFYIVTLEASIGYLNSGKIAGLPESERDVGIPCEVGVGEFWLRCLFNSMDDGEGTPLGEMFSHIRLGNAAKLEECIEAYEAMRRGREVVGSKGVDESLLCHPLCHCPKCALLTNPEPEPKLAPVLQLRNEEGLMLLHVSCIYGRPKIVDYLLSLGAPCDVEDNQGMTPLHYAASRGHQNAVLLLLHTGCNIQPRNHTLNTPLHLASMNGHEPCVKALIYYAEHSKQPISISFQNFNGDTPLHFASRFGFIGIVQLLVESGGSITLTNARQTSPIDCAHDVHILRILQRALRRRSLISTNHDDFVNIDVMKKGETESGCIMLISEPNMPPETETECDQENAGDGSSATPDPAFLFRTQSPEERSRKNSTCSSIPSTVGTLTRKTSSVITPSFSPAITEDDVDNLFRRSTRNKRSLAREDSRPRKDNGEMTFHISNLIPVTLPETEHLKKVSVDNLDHAPHVLAHMASLGVKRKRDVEQRGIRKLFSAIALGDIPLALFYLGIPAEEVENVTEINPGDSVGLIPCHPLCPCNRCTAKSAGLGLGINVKNVEGLTPLQSAVQHNLDVLVKILLKYGADLGYRSLYESKTALEFAKERYYEDIAVTLQLWKAGPAPEAESEISN